jgi:mannose-6-phosphate isomerase-like protein (cupin superfamily)
MPGTARGTYTGRTNLKGVEMPKASRTSASQVREFALAIDRNEDFGDYTVSFVTIKEGHDLAPMLKGLPGDSCQCPHWGYVMAGRLTWQFDDHEEVFEAGDAFYVPPGHRPSAITGSEFIQFSPSQQLQATERAIMENMRAMQGA